MGHMNQIWIPHLFEMWGNLVPGLKALSFLMAGIQRPEGRCFLRFPLIRKKPRMNGAHAPSGSHSSA
jgi:hypothetical protein